MLTIDYELWLEYTLIFRNWEAITNTQNAKVIKKGRILLKDNLYISL